MRVDIYKFNEYKTYLSEVAKKREDSWGIWSKLAAAAGCQATYLSQAMKGKVQLTSDHIIGIAEFLELSDSETEFFLLLLEKARSGTKNHSHYISRRISKMRSEQENLSKIFSGPPLEVGQKESIYYSTWTWAAIHVIVSIPEYRTPEKIAQRLQLPLELVAYSLQMLAQHGVVKKTGNTWALGTGDVHIPKNSPLVHAHHSNWRQKALLDSLLPDTDGVHFTGVHSLSRKDFLHLKEKLLELIQHSKEVIAPSKEEELIAMTFDFFKVR